MNSKMYFRIILTIFIILISFENAEAQCAMCRAVLENNADNSVAEGINDGIVYLMVFPYLLMGGLGYIIYRTYKKKKASTI